jgi:hypothetical protein
VQAKLNGVVHPEEDHTVRTSKMDSKHDFDPSKNKWVKVLSRVNREMSKLKKELHILQTFAAHDSKAGPKAVRQTDEGQRCEVAIKRSKQVWGMRLPGVFCFPMFDVCVLGDGYTWSWTTAPTAVPNKPQIVCRWLCHQSAVGCHLAEQWGRVSWPEMASVPLHSLYDFMTRYPFLRGPHPRPSVPRFCTSDSASWLDGKDKTKQVLHANCDTALRSSHHACR